MAQRKPVPLFETLHKNKNGVIYPVEITVSGITLKGKQFLLVVSRDISERKLGEKLVSEVEQRFKVLAEQAPMFVWMTDENLNTTYANNQVLKYVGLESADQFIDKYWETVVHPDDLKLVRDKFNTTKDSKELISYEYRLKEASSGKYYWFHAKVNPRWEGDKLVGYIGTNLNIEEQKTITDKLERQVAERTSMLEEKIKELAEMNKELESFAYISSHDLQEPLRKIQTFVSILKEKEFVNITERGQQMFNRIRLPHIVCNRSFMTYLLILGPTLKLWNLKRRI